jgi:hypothetical protein
MASEAVPEAIDSLYEVPPAGFVQARNALVKSMKADGKRVQAEETAKLSRPTASVWASNQVARHAAHLVEQLAEATTRLQGGATRDREKYAAAINQHRELLNQVRERVAAVLSGAGLRAAPATVAAAVQNFRTGLMDPHTRPLLLQGRLTADVGVAGGAGLFGLEAFAGGGDEPGATPRSGPPHQANPPAHARGHTQPHAATAKAEAKARERSRRDEERARAKARAEAERHAHALRKAAQAASATREKQEFAVASARHELEAAERRLVEARASERQAVGALGAAESALEKLARRPS